MASSREHFALDWIKSDLLETLNEARIALDEYAEGPGDEPRLRACLTSVHQVHGTLVMLELEGVTLLADHIEQLAQAMLAGTVADRGLAGQYLMQGILELPGYLDELQRGGQDSTGPTLTLVNEIRGLLGLELLADHAGASLTAAADEAAVAKFTAIDGQQKVARIRTAYQTVLLSILKGEDRSAAVGTLTKIAQGLQRVCTDTALERQWQAFGEFVTSLSYKDGVLESEAVKLLRRVDVEIKNLARDGEVALRAPANIELVRQLLDAAVAREHSTEVLSGLQEAVERDVNHNTLAISGRQALASAAQALQEELGSVKDRLDMLVRAQTVDLDELQTLVSPLKQIGSTLSLLGFESSREIVSDQVDGIERLIVLGDGDPQGVQSIAGALVQIDENLSSVVQGSAKTEVEQITSEAQLQVLRESRAGLDEIKQSVVDFVSANFDPRHLEGVDAKLNEICGALEIIPLPSAINLLRQADRYIVDCLCQGQQPEWQSLDLLADGISAIDYYLERLSEENTSGVEDILTVAARSFEQLLDDAPASETAAPEAEAAEPTEQFTEDQPVAAAPLESASAEDELEFDLDEIPVFTDTPAAEGGPNLDLETDAAETAAQETAPGIEPEISLDSEAAPEQPGADQEQTAEAAAEPVEPEEVLVSDTPDNSAEVAEVAEAAEAAEAAEVIEPIEGFDLGAELFDEVAGVVDVADTASDTPVTAQEEPAAEESLEVPEADTVIGADAVLHAPDVDPEIVEIFVEEVAEVLESIDEWLPQWAVALDVGEPITELRRAFHTLKGSGRIVQAAEIGELAWGIENMLNRVMDNTVQANESFVTVVKQARDLIPSLTDAFEVGRPVDLDAMTVIIEQADVLASGGELAASDSLADQAPDEIGLSAESAIADPTAMEAAAEAENESDALEQPSDVAEFAPSDAEPGEAENDLDWLSDELNSGQADLGNAFELFVAEAQEHLQVIDVENAKVPWQLSEPMARAFHTLAGSSAIAGISQVQLIAEPAYQVVEAFRGTGNVAGLQSFLAEAAKHLRGCFDAMAGGQNWDEPLEFVAQADDLLARQPSKASTGQQLLEADATADILDSEDQLRGFLAGEAQHCAELLNALAELSALANKLDEHHVAELATAFMQILTNATVSGRVPDTAAPVMQLAYDRLVGQLNTIAGGGDAADAADVVSQLLVLDFTAQDEEGEAALLSDVDDIQPVADDAFSVYVEEVAPASADDTAGSTDEVAAAADEDVAAVEEDHTAVQADAADVPADPAQADSEDLFDDLSALLEGGENEVYAAPSDQQAEDSESTADDLAAAETPDSGAAQPTVYDDVDPDLIEVFFEEADEISEELEASIMRWSQETDNRIYMENLLRGLHTFKGGARLCGLLPLGDMAHDFESCVIEVQNDERPVDSGLFDELNRRFDELTRQLTSVREQVLGGVGTSLEQPTEPVASPVDGDAASPAAESDLVVQPQAGVVPSAPAAEPVVEKEQATERAPQERTPQEMVRVGSALLEELVNLAGENSILRARIEQGMADFTGSLDEMETTIERLREQLRRLEIETETQILYRHEGPQYENFDPLEMDRYSQLQQLSKSLSESASDMLDLKDTLLFKARESETLLLQQARINTELQEGLMRTRMVPFSRLLPRLRRIVRQVSAELGKEVDFHVQNAEGELDRNLLERMVPPLEHMLRNAVDHGIESAELRRNFGKPVSGRIDLRLSREGGDVVIEISDDGAGVDVESVRAKAVERQLMSADANLSDDEVTQFILAAGFTTAKSVTQISGRGVGMDVVHSEVKQLGGSISILSRPGKGTRFVLRVPFTVSVNRALMVSVADDLYAIPLNTIEGIVLLNPEQLQSLYASEGKTFEYAGTPYRVRYLGQYLGRDYRGLAPGQTSVPMVLVRSGDHAVAIHVDLVQGSREIVVKSLGPQFAGVGGISGATILGDGSVVVILDLLALIRAQQHQRRTKPRSAMAKPGPRCVMVVDDSVTVRKVTSRLLERQGMDVLVAKDGIEAVALLQERRPDVMLLDIEMPRMDGFEVARQVRHDERLGNLPIVMISSRTGDKHKEHANQLGVNKFLGKPFQENELLATIDELVSRI
ncbi:MAG: Hpt domain-containing protein [Pseudomonadota bacterium]